ncbi:hypothetical protein [Streptomyces sp. NBC_00878]|uniref:hypothetical protein n=1 Tax=Streptomyces sp. NBC_00878 TaxID=2975854 RepID=UPI0022554F82|nr:hypothetical protein [Streptomyces sp. NBC_00878]MCX4911204.1 hypothetical protein [Streptomyces sp. NBC_00878]
MRRITIWITATLAVAAFLLAFQLNLSGTTGKSRGDGDHTEPGSTAPADPAQDQAKPGDDTPGDGEHVGKPGENK